MNAVPSDDLNGKDWNVKAEREVRRIMAEAMNGKDHDIIAAKMRNSLSRDVSKGMLYGFVRSASKGRVFRFPLAWAPAFCAATGNYELLRWFLREALHGFPAFKNSVTESRNALRHTLMELEKLTQKDK